MRIGIVGYGYWGPNLARNFAAADGCSVVRISDLRRDRLALAQKLLPGVGITTSTDDVIEASDVDAVAVATPISTHFDLASRALRAGKHVLVEKPMTASAKEASQLVELARERGLVLAVDHTFLYAPAIERVKAMVQEGLLGKVHYFDSTRINLGLFQRDLNVLWDLASHDVSILLHLFPERPETVQATGASHTASGLEDIAYMTLRYASGMIAHFNVSWISPVKLRSILIGGSKKMVVYNDLDPVEKVKVYDSGFEVKTESEKQQALIDYRTGDIFVPRIAPREALAGLAKDFVESARAGKPPVSSGALGLEVVRVLEAAQRSLASGGVAVELGAVA